MNCATVFVVIFCVAAVYGDCPKDCAHKKLTFLYESFHCEPQCSNSKDECPTEYKCADLNVHKNTCYFNGDFYNLKDKVDNSLTWEHCLGCECYQEDQKPAKFLCYSGSCNRVHVDPGCHVDEKLGQCCHSSQVCPPFQSCTVNGTKHLEGEKFPHPSDKCTTCYCGKGNDGIDLVLKCEKQYCLDLLRHQDEIRKHCAPVYPTIDTCCPATWICPEEGTTTITHEGTPKTPSEPQCQFGAMRLNKGTKFSSSGQFHNATCECILPPFASCESSDY